MTPVPLSILIVEDEVLLAAELGFIIGDAGCREVGHATNADEALALARGRRPDLALIDVHLGDGPSGIDVARQIVANSGGTVLFMTANLKRLPGDFAGAGGVIGKPYSEYAMHSALRFLESCLRRGVAPGPPPAGLQIAPAYQARWDVHPAGVA